MRLVSIQYTLNTGAFEIYIAGCREHPCKGCFSPELWSEDIGELLTEKSYTDLKNKINKQLLMIDNIMIFGGEPLEKPKKEVLELLNFLKQFNKPIWLFTRFEIDNVDKEILSKLNYIKCGMYDNTKAVSNYIIDGMQIASSNQKVYKIIKSNKNIKVKLK